MPPIQQKLACASSDSRDADRVFVHVDMDGFYAQVEHRRLNIPRHIPLGVQQWHSLIAINYPAKRQGVKRGMPARVAKEICPDIQFVHVEVVGNDDDEVRDELIPDQARHKASLRRYREASNEVMQVLENQCGHNHFERSSIDEAYFELTEDVQKFVESLFITLQRDMQGVDTEKLESELENVRTESAHLLNESERKEEDSHRTRAVWVLRWLQLLESLSYLVRSNPTLLTQKGFESNTTLASIKCICQSYANPVHQVSPLMRSNPNHSNVCKLVTGEAANLATCEVSDFYLLIGALFVWNIRQRLWNATQFTASAGIARNKFIAKEISAKHKPNAQTIVFNHDIDEVLKGIKIRQARGLRGKCGKFVVSVLPTCSSLFDIQQFSLEQLQKKFDAKGADDKFAEWIYALSRGITDSEIKQVSRVKSMLAIKAFPPQITWKQLEYWIDVLCKELATRLDAEYQLTQRVPKTIVIHHTGGRNQQSRTRSAAAPKIQGPLKLTDILPFVKNLVKTRLSMEEMLPCNRFGVAATDLHQQSISVKTPLDFFKIQTPPQSSEKSHTTSSSSTTKQPICTPLTQTPEVVTLSPLDNDAPLPTFSRHTNDVVLVDSNNTMSTRDICDVDYSVSAVSSNIRMQKKKKRRRRKRPKLMTSREVTLSIDN